MEEREVFSQVAKKKMLLQFFQLREATFLNSCTIDITVLRGYETAANTDSIRRFLKTVIASLASIATHSNP